MLLLGPAQSLHTRRWAAALAGRGHRVVLAGWAPAEPLAGVDLRVPPGAPGAGRSSLGAVRRLLATGWWLRREVRQVRPDVVHVHSVGRAGLLALALPRVPVRVVTPWGSELRAATRSRLRRWVTRLTLHRADLVVPTSRSVTEEITRRYRVPAARTATLSWGVDDTLLASLGTVDPAAVRRRHGIPEQATVLLSMRGVAPVYRPDDVLSAYAHVRGERPDLHLVVLAGHVPGEASAAREHAAGLARVREMAGTSSGRLTLVDRTLSPAETFALMRASDVALSVPRGDQRSSAVLEAALAGCRLLLSDLPPYRELLADGLVAEVLPEPLATTLAGRLRTVQGLPAVDRATNRAFIETHELWSRQVSAMEHWYRRLSSTSR